MDLTPGRWLSALAATSVRRAVWMVLAWLAFAVAVNIGVPQLETVVAKDSTPILPEHAPSAVALAEMDQTFGNGRSTSFVFVVLERDGGLTQADRRYYRGLVPRLRADRESVSFVLDVVRRPQLVRALTSRDGEAMYLQVGLPGATGAPAATQQIEAIRETVREHRPEGLDVAVTGPAATIADMSTEVEHSILLITVATVGLIAVILMVIYRSIAVTALILGVIGLALATSRAVTAWMGLHAFSVSTFTASFLTAVVLGAATDYAVFLVSRFQELRRAGLEPVEAAIQAAGRVSGVIIGSALTVVAANAAMVLADVGIFSTTGPAIAVSVAVTLLISLTLTPAVLALAGSRGLMDPRPGRHAAGTSTGWERLGALVVARPARVLAAGLLPLVLLAMFYPFLQVSFDERGVQPDDTQSNLGYDILAAHFPVNEVLPDYVIVTADHDLRNARDLATLEQTAGSIARTEGVVSVRGITRPLGTPITEASVGHQAGVVGDRLTDADGDLAAGEQGASALADGSRDLDEGAGQIADGADRAVDGAGRLVDGVTRLSTGLDRLAAGSGDATSGSRQIRHGARTLADALDSAYDQTKVAVDGLGLAHDALLRSLTCGLDPYCRGARDGIAQIHAGERDKLLPGLLEAAAGARAIADGSAELTTGLARIESGLDRARTGAEELSAGQRTMRAKLGELADGADQVAEGTGQVEDGTAEMKQSVTELRSGMSEAARYLRQTGRATKDPAIGGFYLPPAAWDDPRMAMASGLFLSPDGRTARLVVLGDSDSFQRPATERAAAVRRAAEDGLRGTRLERADLDLTGVPSINGDLEELADADFRMVALIALVAVFLILVLLLRSLVAPLFLLASVALSYAAAIGLGVLVWQILLDQPLDWSVPAIAFILLVAVGADYNLLLMKRMQEDAPDGSRAGIAQAVAATGGVITSAGVIFAASMFAMMAGSVVTLAQIGFTIGMGLLLDTFVVRTLVVPAVAALLGRNMWWPHRVPAAHPATPTS